MADFSEVRWEAARWERAPWSVDRAFAEFLARDVGVAAVPGSSFFAGGGTGRSSVRFNYAKHRTTLETAVQRLRILERR